MEDIRDMLVSVNILLIEFNAENEDSDMLRENIILSDAIESWLDKVD